MLIIFSLISTLLLGILVIFFYIREKRVKKQLLQDAYRDKRRLYEISILKIIQDKIGYSLDIKEVVDTLVGSLKNVFSYSVASSLVVDDNKLIFKSYVDEAVNPDFIFQIKKSMLASLKSLSPDNLPDEIEEIFLGIPLDTLSKDSQLSFFDIPLVVSGRTLGIIHISSKKENFYQPDDIKFFFDIAKQASNALSKLESVIESENGKLLAMISSLAEGIFMIDSKNSTTIINENAKKFLSLQNEKPTPFEIINSFPSQFNFASKIQEVLKEKKTFEEKEITIGNKVLHIQITPVINKSKEANAKNQVLGASVLLQDITFDKALTKLKEDFTSQVVHELRSPLSAIQSGSELMINAKEKLDKEQEKKLLEIINKQSKRMLGDINSLLDAAKLESGHFAIYQKPENVEILLHDALSLFNSEAEKKKIILNLEIEENLPKGLFDQIRIGQVIDNLISNSLKYTPENGQIVITAKRYENKQFPQSQTNPGILISISDNGIGIPPEKQSNLFSKFARLENIGYVHSHEGTGLGLYIAKGIVEAHGGKIFLESYPNKGTTVSFTLPILGDQNESYQYKLNSAKEISDIKLIN